MAQGLAGPRPAPTAAGILALFRRLGCVQIDPIRAVERTQLLTLWSRLGRFDPALLDQLQQEERAIFEGWAHAASFVLTEDYPLHAHWMGERSGGGEWGQRVREWLAANDELRHYILERLAAEGPLPTDAFEDRAVVPWESTGWSAGRNVTRMLDFLNGRGQVLSVGRTSNAKLWHLTQEWLHEWADHEPWPQERVVTASIRRSLLALGVASPGEIKNYFLRGSYPGLGDRLGEMVAAGEVLPAQIVETETGEVWPGDRFIHRESLPVLAQIRNGDWQPRTLFLSPFDNLIAHRPRTEQLFDFYYRIEIYVPKAKRQYGYYVLPLLHGDRFIGRMDSKLDRKTGVYHIHALYPERPEDVNDETGAALAATLSDLAAFIGAQEIAPGEQIPAAWRESLLK